jgi:5'-phosphate synthase pdxT subunit
MSTGVLALQGDFREHEAILKRLGVRVERVRRPEHLERVDRLIIPGGESTTIGTLMQSNGLLAPVRQRAGRDLALWGTCAGAILLARTISEGAKEGQPLLGLMDVVVRRNGFGRQQESFECDLDIPALGEQPVHGVFIRAPIIEATGPEVEILGYLPAQALRQHPQASPVAARQGRLLVATFHPELTSDDRFHRYFLEL